jgi:hypothetical protein
MNEVPVSLIVRSTRPPRRKILRNAIVVVGVLFLGGIGSSFYRNHAAECAIREALEETDRREPAGWRLDAIEEQRRAKAPRAEDNAAVTVATVRVAIPKTWPTRPPTSNELFEAQLKRKFDPPPQDAPEGGRQDVDLVIELNPACFATLYERVDLPTEVQMDAVLTKELRAELARIQQAVDLADKLADQKDGHVPINWPANPWSTPIPWVDDARSVATMLRFRALLQAQDNDLDGALRTSRAILGAGRSVRDDEGNATPAPRRDRRADAATGSPGRTGHYPGGVGVAFEWRGSVGRLRAMRRAVDSRIPYQCSDCSRQTAGQARSPRATAGHERVCRHHRVAH